jgi:glucose 1-dehydrogenase
VILTGKTAIVTGGAAGIGAAIAERYLREGARVIITDVDQERGRRTEKELSGLGQVSFIKADVGKRLDIHNMVAAAIDALGDIDILVNNAGVDHTADFLDLKEDDFDRVMRVNLTGPLLAGQAVGRYLVDKVKAGGAAGTIINMSAVGAFVATADRAAYSISMGGLAQLTKAMALSLAPWGIRVNAIAPGAVMTGMMDSVIDDPAARQRVMSRTPLGRIAEPREIAGIAVFLASDDSSYVSGETIFADGGRMALDYTVPPKLG